MTVAAPRSFVDVLALMPGDALALMSELARVNVAEAGRQERHALVDLWLIVHSMAAAEQVRRSGVSVPAGDFDAQLVALARSIPLDELRQQALAFGQMIAEPDSLARTFFLRIASIFAVVLDERDRRN
jgi:hypothetical protein